MPAYERLHYMDNLRALAMLTGVLFHAALAYSPLIHPYFPTADRAQSPLVDGFAWFVHLFRMPLFFVVAGYFAALLVAKRGMAGFFRDRVRRIVVPFVLFLPPVLLVLTWSTMQAAQNVQHPSPLLVVIAKFAAMDDPPTPPPGTGHLWFLYYLSIFYVLVWALSNFELARVVDWLRDLHPAWQLGLLPLATAPALAAVSAPHPAPESFLPAFWAFGYFGLYFACGFALYRNEILIQRYRPYAPWLLVASVLLYAAFLRLLDSQPPGLAQPTASWPMALIEAYLSIWLTVVCLVFGKALLDCRLSPLRWLADASYWTYIVHLPVLFVVQYRLMDLNLAWWQKYGVSVLVTMAVSLLSYELLVRRTPLRHLVGVALRTDRRSLES